MIRAEWRYLIKHKLLLIVLAVVMLIPSIYAVTFLKSMWDPYGKLDDLPIAVVNQDRAVRYHDQSLAAGQALTRNLKASTAMKFTPVATETAAQHGLQDGKYYMVITIPQNFSHNATTLMNQQPHQMVLHYETSAGHSFIAAKLTAGAAKSAAQAVSANVTKSYAKTMFATVKQLGHGLTQAGKGSHRLAAGGQQLTQADHRIAAGLNTLTTSTVKLTNGENTITNQLAKYVNGVQQAQSGSHQLSTGLDQLLSKSAQLTTGVQKLAAGSHQVSAGVAAYTQGTNKLDTAAHQLASGSRTTKTGMQRYVAGITATNAGAQQLSDNLATFAKQTNQLTTSTTALTDGGQKLNASYAKLATGSAALTTGLQKIQSGLQTSRAQQATLKRAVAQLTTSQQSTTAVKDDASKLQAALGALASANRQQSDNLQTKLAATADAQGLTATQKAAMLKAARDSTHANTLSKAQAAAKQLRSDLNQLNDTPSATTLQNNLTKSTSAQDALLAGISSLTTNSTTLTNGLRQANQSLTHLTDGLTVLNSQAPSLNEGTTRLAKGAAKLASGTGQLTTKGDQLVKGTAQLATGNGQLAEGTHQLASKNTNLTNGANRLATGLTTLNQQTPQLSHGVSQLASGATTLSSGLNTLATNGPKLTDALQAAANGTQQVSLGAKKLATGAHQAANGATKLQSGNMQLTTALNKAGKKATVHPSQLTYKQFAEPTTTTHSDPDDAPNNGTGMAPYMMSVSLFVGALAFNLMFDMYTPRKYPRSGWRWWLGKASIMAAFVLGEALFMTGLLVTIDGLAPIHPWATFMMLLITGGTFMSIVYWLNLALGKPGAFFSMVLLVLQLGGSAGTYPLQLTNGFFRAIHPWLPMSYTVNGLRETLMIGNSAMRDMIVLVMIMLIFTLLAILFYARRHGRIDEIDIPES